MLYKLRTDTTHYEKKTSTSTIEYMEMICSLVRHYLFMKNSEKEVEEVKHNLGTRQLFLLQWLQSGFFSELYRVECHLPTLFDGWEIWILLVDDFVND